MTIAVAHDIVAPSRRRGLAALLDHTQPPWPQDALPPLGHWLLFPPEAIQSELGQDGHPRREAAFAEAGLTRRMWAASEVTIFAPLRVGARVERRSVVQGSREREGRSGRLALVTVRHDISADGTPAVAETQTIVYRDAAATSPALPAISPGRPATFTRAVRPDSTLLFRFSALTFNAHRIHYDRPYATGTEGYPGLVVHGPLVATLLLDLLLRERPEADIRSFRFRAERPLFDATPFYVQGRVDEQVAELWATGPDGGVAMQAAAELA